MLKCTKFDFGWGFAAHRWGSLQRSSDPRPPLRGLLLRGGEEKGEREGKEGVRKNEKGGRGREGKAFPLLWFYNLTTGTALRVS